MKQRLTFKCWKCERNYSLLLELKGEPKLNLECPFCGEGCMVDLDPYGEDIVEVFRSSGSAEKKNMGITLNFPDTIPTTPMGD